MGVCLCGSANLMCTFGAAASVLNVIQAEILAGGKPMACVSDKENTNIATFGMCSSLKNPAVSSATAASLGVLTPQPCTPLFGGGWMPNVASVLIGGKPAVALDAKLSCVYEGIISIVEPGQTSVIAG